MSAIFLAFFLLDNFFVSAPAFSATWLHSFFAIAAKNVTTRVPSGLKIAESTLAWCLRGEG